MPESSLVVKMDGEASKLDRGLDKTTGKAEQLEGGMKKVAKQTKEGERELQRFAKQMTRLNATPQEKMARKQEMLNQALKRGLITQQTYNRAIAHMNTQQSKAFGAGMMGRLGNVASMMGAVAGPMVAAQGARFLVDQGKRVGASALEQFRSREVGEREFLQIAEGSTPREIAADFGKLNKMRERLIRKFGVDVENASKVVFDARSLGFEDQLDTLGRFSRVGDIGVGSLLVGKTRKLFEKSGVTGEQMLNMALTAAKESVLNIEQLGTVLPIAAEGAGATAATPSEVLATTSVLSKDFASAQSTAQRIKAFALKLSLDDRFKGQGLVESVQTIQAMSQRDRRKFLGDNQETNAAFRLISENQDAIQMQAEKIRNARKEAGSARSALRARTGAFAFDETLAIREEARVSEAVANAGLLDRFGIQGEREAAARNRMVAEMTAQGRTRFEIGTAQFAAESVGGLGAGEGAQELAGSAASGYLRLIPALWPIFLSQQKSSDKLDRAATALEKIADGQGAPSQTSAAQADTDRAQLGAIN